MFLTKILDKLLLSSFNINPNEDVKGKKKKKTADAYSYLDSWFMTGDAAKDMQTLKNTV